MKKLLLFLFILSSLCSNAELKYSGEVEYFGDYEEEREGVYTFEIKGQAYSYTYEVIKEKGTYFFPVFEFLKIIGLKNYSFKNGELKIFLGENLEEKIIDFNSMDKSVYIYQDKDYYISQKLFKEYFFEELDIDSDEYKIQSMPNFNIPNEIKYIIDAKDRNLEEENNKEVLYYEGERKLADIGNMRINLEQEFTNDTGRGSDNDWTGYLEYSGSLLYGNFTTDYDLKEKEFGDFELTYSNILNGEYELNLGVYGEDREKGFTFKKDRGYFEEGREYVIREKVPLGSRVELLYNNFPIEIEYEENGYVVFTNNIIKSGREFTLKIYEPDGKIYEKVVKINDDYNQQAKGEFGYDLSFRERKGHDGKSTKNDADFNIYYGYTDNLTLGLSYRQYPELFGDDYIYGKELGGELIYSNSIDGNPYTFTYEVTRGLNRSKNDEQNLKHNFRRRFMLDTDIKNFDINYEQYDNGSFYEKRREQYLQVEYDINEYVTLIYDREDFKFHDSNSSDEEDYYYGVELNKSFNNLLVNYVFGNNKDKEREHQLDFYYTGFRNFTVKLENSFDENDEYEGELTINNASWSDKLDYSLGVKYSSKTEYVYTFEFTLKLDNWFEIGTLLEKNGSKRTYVGIDRVINLKNPTKNMNSLENTTIKAVAFLDKNNNNKLDDGEELLSGVDVTLGKTTVTTDEDGTAYIYGVSSYVDYELTALSKRPSHDGRANKIKVRGIGSSEVTAYIPIKPMISLVGTVSFPKDESASSDVRISFMDVNETFVKTLHTDMDGTFYLDSLTAGRYIIVIEYIGEDYNIKRFRRLLNLRYTDENGGENERKFILKEVAE